ncbi:MAG: hypothetical protein IPI67_00125 [Myxococcales bacterium]|nr:hypothetical protein [Myxococcales bacterium]
MLLASRRVLLLVSGAGKRSALVQALAAGDEDVIPARIYLAAPAGVVTVIMDAAAQGFPCGRLRSGGSTARTMDAE